jgi:hypothetical protein
MRRAAVTAVLLAASLATAPVAAAAVGSTGQTGPSKVVNPGDPGSSQYQEDVPSAFGGVPATTYARHARAPAVQSVVLPHAVVSTLAGDGRAGRAAAALAIAGTPTPAVVHHRAPPARHHPAATARHRRRTKTPTRRRGAAAPVHLVAGPGRSVTASIARSVFGSDGGLGDLLPVVLGMSALFAAGVAVGRRRGGRGRSG